MKKIIVGFLALLILGSTGCVTYGIWGSNPVKESKSRKNIDLKDNIITAFEYKDVSVKDNQTNENVKNIKFPDVGYGFMGEKYVYILTEGSTELMELNELVKIIPLAAFDNPEGIIRLNIQKENKAGLIEFSENYRIYTDAKFKLNSQQVEALERLGFHEKAKLGKVSWNKTIKLKGYLFDKNNMTFPAIPKDNLNGSYKVEFYTTENYESFSAGNLAGNILVTPFTLAADIIATPALLILYGSYVGSK
nr:hypothetical protein [uncultured Moellerella sp.]